MSNNWTWKKIITENNEERWIAYRVCDHCGKEYECGGGFNSRYCSDCRPEIRAEQNRERVRNHRARIKAAAANATR